jgi:hypothetical protein
MDASIHMSQMREVAQFPWGAPAVRAGRTLLLGLVLGVVLGGALPPAWGGLTEAARALLAAADGSRPARSPMEWEPRPLPREWRWSPPSVDVSGMFRKPRAAR